jgi:hypothetical protein
MTRYTNKNAAPFDDLFRNGSQVVRNKIFVTGDLNALVILTKKIGD